MSTIFYLRMFFVEKYYERICFSLEKCLVERRQFELSYHVWNKVDDLKLFVAEDHGQGGRDVQLGVDDPVELVPEVENGGDVDNFDFFRQFVDVVGKKGDHDELKLVSLAGADVQDQAVGDKLEENNLKFEQTIENTRCHIQFQLRV